MAQSLDGCIRWVQSQIMTVPGMRQAPPAGIADNANIFPFAMCYPDSMEFTGRGACNLRGKYTLNVVVFCARKDASRDMEFILPFLEPVVTALWGGGTDDNNLGGNCNSFENMTAQLTEFQFAGYEVIGFTIQITGVSIMYF